MGFKRIYTFTSVYIKTLSTTRKYQEFLFDRRRHVELLINNKLGKKDIINLNRFDNIFHSYMNLVFLIHCDHPNRLTGSLYNHLPTY